jgi:hypothetical protein
MEPGLNWPCPDEPLLLLPLLVEGEKLGLDGEVVLAGAADA